MAGRVLLDTNMVIALFANDVWIAATAMQCGLIPATRDAHFNEVDGLSVANW